MEDVNVLVTKFIPKKDIAFQGRNQMKLIMDPAKNLRNFVMEFVSVLTMLFLFLGNAFSMMITSNSQHNVLDPFLILTPFVGLLLSIETMMGPTTISIINFGDRREVFWREEHPLPMLMGSVNQFRTDQAQDKSVMQWER